MTTTQHVDSRRRPFVAIDLHFPFKNTCGKLEAEFGHAGPLAFLYLIMAAKRAPVQGELTFTTDADFWAQIGFVTPPDFDVDTFLHRLGNLRQTRLKRPSKHLRTVLFPHFERWQRLPEAELNRRRSARKRAQNTRDETRTIPAPSPHEDRTERRGEETTVRESPPTGRETLSRDATDSTTRGSAAATNGRRNQPTPSLAEHHKTYRPERAEQYARNVGHSFTPAELEADLTAEFHDIPPAEATRLAHRFAAAEATA